MKTLKCFFYGMMFILGMIFVTLVMEIGMRAEDNRVEICAFQHNITLEYGKYVEKQEALNLSVEPFDRHWVEYYAGVEWPQSLKDDPDWFIDREGNIVGGRNSFDYGVFHDLAKLLRHGYSRLLNRAQRVVRG